MTERTTRYGTSETGIQNTAAQVGHTLSSASPKATAAMLLQMENLDGEWYLGARPYLEVHNDLITGGGGIRASGLFSAADGGYDARGATRALLAACMGGFGDHSQFFRQYLGLNGSGMSEDALDHVDGQFGVIPGEIAVYLDQEPARTPIDVLLFGRPRRRVGLPTGYESSRLFEDVVDASAESLSVQAKIELMGYLQDTLARRVYKEL